MAVENEFKFTSEKDLDPGSVAESLRSFLSSKNVPFKEKSKQSVDLYFDTEGLDLYKEDCILRQKTSSNGKIKLTVKRPISNEMRMMSREEIETESDGSWERVLSFSEEHLPGRIVLEKPSLTIECERIAFDYKDGSGIKLSLDVCDYVDGPTKKRFYEIELESVDDSTNREFDSIGMCQFIEDLGFAPVTESKYRRGVAWRLSANALI